MMIIQPGEFWVAEIFFTSGGGSKKRPVLVLWLDGEDAIVALVTSATPRTPTDVSLNDWSASGLRVASVIRLSRLSALEQSLFLGKIGDISSADAEQVKMVWSSLVKPQF